LHHHHHFPFSMARQHLCVCAALYFFAFLLPLVAARLGCRTSLFFPDLNSNDLRTLTILRAADGNENGASAGFKIFSVAASKIEHHRLPPNLVQVRLLNLHRQTLFNPGSSHSLDAWKDASVVEKPFVEHPTHNELVHTWSVSTSDPHRPITWIDVHSRRGMWRHDFADRMEQKPLHQDDDEWRASMNDLWRIAFGLLVGAASGMVFAVTLALVWSLLRRLCVRSHDDDDVGFLYGYQELPSPRSSEKEDVKDSQKEFTKESAGAVENM